MPCANKSSKPTKTTRPRVTPKKRIPASETKVPPKGEYKKKTGGPLTDASAPIAREDKPRSKDGSLRGRIPGTKAKNVQLLEDAQALIAEEFGVENWHPVIHMMLVAADKTADAALRLNAAAKAAPYICPTLRAIELTGGEGGPIQVDLTESKNRLLQMAGVVINVDPDEENHESAS